MKTIRQITPGDILQVAIAEQAQGLVITQKQVWLIVRDELHQFELPEVDDLKDLFFCMKEYLWLGCDKNAGVSDIFLLYALLPEKPIARVRVMCTTEVLAVSFLKK